MAATAVPGASPPFPRGGEVACGCVPERLARDPFHQDAGVAGMRHAVTEDIGKSLELRDSELVSVFFEERSLAAASCERICILRHGVEALQHKRCALRVLHMEQLHVAQARFLAALSF
ncbi:MAG: hypothetical protein DUD39_09570 [Coriobacteriaceae bacterium]|nr:MAG: hypothetical protein DUD39_09570 [Coriobacteriaceae bacterium]